MATKYGDPNLSAPVNVQPSSTTTTVIIQQPIFAQAQVRNWSTGICDCFDDMTICLCGAFCGLCLAIRVSSQLGESALLPFCVPQFQTALRTKLRTHENIQGSILNDCLLETCCGPCSLCQLAREVKAVAARSSYQQ